MKMPKEVEGKAIGFNMNTQKLHCLIVMNDTIGKALSERAGKAFFRAFVVEDRASGEILLNQRFRYVDGDSWMRVVLNPEKQKLSREERVEYLASGIEKTMRTAAEVMASAPSPKEMITRHYPPDPEDGQKTMEWLLAQDLVEISQMFDQDGREILVNKGEA